MNSYTPAYFHAFRCIAGACPDSCCKEWEVDVDPASADFYRSLPGALGDRLRQVLRDTPDGTLMTIENGRCPMWRQDGLCRIHAELDHDALCQVCREFPRLTHDYGSFLEKGLELSCPEAARLILTGDQTLTVQSVVCDPEEEAYDVQTMAILLRTRQTALEVLADSPLPLPQILAVLLLYAHAVQEELDGGEPAELESDCLDNLRACCATPDPDLLLAFFQTLEILTPQWQQRLSNGPRPGPWHEIFRNLIRYGILRYWLQTISDLDLVCRVKLILTACLLVRILGGDPIQTAQQFSKEIENDPDNVEAILDAAYTEPALTDAHLLGLLLLS